MFERDTTMATRFERQNVGLLCSEERFEGIWTQIVRPGSDSGDDACLRWKCASSKATGYNKPGRTGELNAY
jgi:hypothetical protein